MYHNKRFSPGAKVIHLATGATFTVKSVFETVWGQTTLQLEEKRPEQNYFAEFYELEEVYNSPLLQAMREENE